MQSPPPLSTSARVLKLPAPFASSARYDSGWWLVDNRHNQNINFEHKLGVIPTQLTLMFSPDRETVFYLPASWNIGNTSNPVSMWSNTSTLTLAFASNYPLHGRWDARTTEWVYWNEGFLRVILNP